MNIRPSQNRGATKLDWLDSKHSFSFGDYWDPKNVQFGALRVINEDIVKEGNGFGQHGHKNMEILTYVLSGQLEHKDSMGNGSVIGPGSIQRMSAGTGVLHSEWNHSKTEPVHFLQIWVMPKEESLPPSYEEKKIANGGKGEWQVLASSDPSKGGVSLNQDLTLSHGHFSGQEKLTQNIAPDRMAWVQVISGTCDINGKNVSAGDGIAISEPGQFSLSTNGAGSQTRVLWFDLEKA